jgi:hypothetical protein
MNLQRLNHVGIENLNRPIMSMEIKKVLNIPSKKSSKVDGFAIEFYEK